MKIIDIDSKGNAIRFYLGEKTDENGWLNTNVTKERPDLDWSVYKNKDYFGDDWDDAPYEHNAGRVYNEYIKDYADVAFDFDDLILFPTCDNISYDSPDKQRGFTKEDMIKRKVPAMVVVPKSVLKENNLHSWALSFNSACLLEDSIKYYFGDDFVNQGEQHTTQDILDLDN